MVRFLDGPAAGEALMLKRTPVLLRAVKGANGWDALDQLADTPAPDETIVVYRLEQQLGWVHINARKGRGFFQHATYRVLEPQPADNEVRDTAAWRAWAIRVGRELDPEAVAPDVSNA